MLVLLGALTGCQKAPERPIRIGLLLWPPYELFYLAQHRGDLEEAGIQLVDFTTNVDVANAFDSGTIDGLCITSDHYIASFRADPEVKIILAVDFSNGGDALVARPDIATLNDLRGRTVAVNPSSLGAHFLARALDQADIEFEDVTLRYLDEIEQFEAYTSGEVDAVAAFEPVRSKLIEAGAQTLFDSSQIPEEIVDVLIVRKSLIEERGADLKILVDSFFQSRQEFLEHPAEAAMIMAPRERMTPEDFLQSLDGTVILSREKNRQLLTGAGAPFLETLAGVAEVLHRAGAIQEIPDVSAAIDDRFVRESGP